MLHHATVSTSFGYCRGIAPASLTCVGSRVNALHSFSPLQAIFLALRCTKYYWPLMGFEQHLIVAHSCQHDQVLSHSHIICYLNQHHATASQDRQCLHLIQNNPNISKLKGAMTSLTIHKAHKGSTRLRERYATQVTGTRPSSLR